MSKLDKQEIRRLKTIGHKLKPVITIAGNGLSETVLAETNRALNDHELIKVKLAVGDRDMRAELTRALCKACSATLVQSIGGIVLLLRRSAKPDHRLSNLQRVL